MADFLLNITDPVTGEPDITVASGILSIVDHSNYDDGTEAGHDRANFSDFYKVEINLPDGGSYLYSSIGDGDEVIDTPDNGDPTVDYPYSTGDGVYTINIYTLPTYSNSAAYLIADTPYVYSGGKIWQLLQNAMGQTPAENTYWTEIINIDDLPIKYRLSQKFVVYDSAQRTYARKVYNANCVNNRIGDNWEQLLVDPEFREAMRLWLAIRTIPVLILANDWAGVVTTINLTKTISA